MAEGVATHLPSPIDAHGVPVDAEGLRAAGKPEGERDLGFVGVHEVDPLNLDADDLRQLLAPFAHLPEGVGEKVAIGYGATYPTVANATERYEVASVTAVGRPGTQAFLGADAPADSTNIKATSVANISAGDKIRLDIDSVGHGIETVTVTRVGTQANRAH